MTHDAQGDSAHPDITTMIDKNTAFPPIRRVTVAAPFRWLAAGWRDLRESGGSSLFYGVCFALMATLIRIVLSNAPQFLSALTCGFLLLGPLLALGVYDISRRLENARSGLLGSVFSMRGRWGNIGVLALVLAVIMMVWARASLVIFALFYNKGMPTMERFLAQLFSVENLEFVFVYLCVGLVFASIVFAISWVSIALMLDRDTDAITSMIISCVSLFINFPAAMLWAGIVVTFVIIGFLSWNLGMIVLMPWIGHATWHAYKNVVGTAEDRAQMYPRQEVPDQINDSA